MDDLCQVYWCRRKNIQFAVLAGFAVRRPRVDLFASRDTYYLRFRTSALVKKRLMSVLLKRGYSFIDDVEKARRLRYLSSSVSSIHPERRS